MVQETIGSASVGWTLGPDAFLGYTVARLATIMQTRMDSALRGATGLTVRQFGILAHLAEDPGMGSGKLARLVMVTPQSMGPLVDKLAATGLLLRSSAGPGQRREMWLTQAGHAALQRGYAVATALADEEKTLVGEKGFEQLNAGLLHLLAGLSPHE